MSSAFRSEQIAKDHTPAETVANEETGAVLLELLTELEQLDGVILGARSAAKERLELLALLGSGRRELIQGPGALRIEEVRHDDMRVQSLSEDICTLLSLGVETEEGQDIVLADVMINAISDASNVPEDVIDADESESTGLVSAGHVDLNE